MKSRSRSIGLVLTIKVAGVDSDATNRSDSIRLYKNGDISVVISYS